MTKDNCTYESALERVQEIVGRIENNQLPLDALSRELREAQELLKFCKSKLVKTEKEVNELLENVEK